MEDIRDLRSGENVPGAFSSNKGEDFRQSLKACAGSRTKPFLFLEVRNGQTQGEILADGFSLAWRVLDAQYWGVPQRRKRIYLCRRF